MRDLIELLLIAAWCYGNGYLFAWLMTPLAEARLRIAAGFGLVGMILGFWGKEVERTKGFFPGCISYVIAAIPLLCTLVGVVYWLVELAQRWLYGL